MYAGLSQKPLGNCDTHTLVVGENETGNRESHTDRYVLGPEQHSLLGNGLLVRRTTLHAFDSLHLPSHSRSTCNDGGHQHENIKDCSNAIMITKIIHSIGVNIWAPRSRRAIT
jgi:hypothetical protein